jgi:hypothetical protein
VCVFDASQYLSNIIAGDYANPFGWGFDLMVASVHKNFPGPQNSDPRLEALKPRLDKRLEAKLRRERRHLATLGSGDQRLSLRACGWQVESDCAEAERAGVPEADRVLAVGLPVDAALDTSATRAGRGLHR